MLSEVSPSSFFLRRGCVQRRRRLKVLVAQNKTPEQIRVLGGKGSELRSSDIKLPPGERTSRVPRSDRNSQQGGGGALVGIKGQKKNKAGRRVFFSLVQPLATLVDLLYNNAKHARPRDGRINAGVDETNSAGEEEQNISVEMNLQ